RIRRESCGSWIGLPNRFNASSSFLTLLGNSDVKGTAAGVAPSILEPRPPPRRPREWQPRALPPAPCAPLDTCRFRGRARRLITHAFPRQAPPLNPPLRLTA